MSDNNYKYAVIIASDSRSRGEKLDSCIKTIEEALNENYVLVYSKILPDEIDVLENEMKGICDRTDVSLIFTSGGTGFSKRDVTPEATLNIIERATPGISEAVRIASREKTPYWMLSRAISGIRGKTLIINLSGHPKAVSEGIKGILPALDHGLDILIGNDLQHE